MAADDGFPLDDDDVVAEGWSSGRRKPHWLDNDAKAEGRNGGQ